MNVRSILFSFCLLTSTLSHSQSYSFDWVAPIGGAGSEVNSFLSAADGFGNVYTIGDFDSIADFDSGPGSFLMYSGHDYVKDIFVRKVNAAGAFVWAFKIGRPNFFETAYTLIVDPSGDIIISGMFSDTLDVDPSTSVFNVTSSGIGGEMFVAKYSSAGNFIWAKQTQNIVSSGIVSFAAKSDPAGNIYLTGAFDGVIDMDPGPAVFSISSTIGSSCFILKLDNSGNFLWVQSIGEGSTPGKDCRAYSINLDPAGNILLTGFYKGTCDFDPGPAVSNLIWPDYDHQIYISKLDPSGNLLWAKGIGARVFIDEFSVDIVADASGNIYCSGHYDTIPDMDPGAGTTTLPFAGFKDTFVCKFDPAGNLIWAKGFGSAGLDVPNSLLLINNKIYLSGLFQYTMDFDPGVGTVILTPSGFYDNYILSLDTSGSFSNVMQIRSSPGAVVYAGSMVRDINENIILTGGFEMGPADFDPGPANHDVYPLFEDVFVLKLHASLQSISENSNAVLTSIYPNPSSGIITVNSKIEFSKIEVMNTLGETVYSSVVASTETKIDLSNQSQGIYFVIVTSEKGLLTQKVCLTR